MVLTVVATISIAFAANRTGDTHIVEAVVIETLWIKVRGAYTRSYLQNVGCGADARAATI